MNSLEFTRLPRRMLSDSIWNATSSLLIAFLALASSSSATPITFAFDAIVTKVDVIIPPFQLPIPVAIGDVIHAHFSFESPPSGNFSEPHLPVRFDIGGVRLESSSYLISEEFNEFPPSASSIGFFDGSGTPIDSLIIECPPFGPWGKVEVPGSPGVQWNAGIGCDGPSPILTGLNPSHNLSEWNALSSRFLWLNFQSRFGAAAIEAVVGPMVAVPEPTSLSLISTLPIPALIWMTKRRRTSAHRSPSSPQVQRYKIRRPTAKKDVPKILPGDHPARLRLSHGQTPSRGSVPTSAASVCSCSLFKPMVSTLRPRIASTAPGQKPSLNVCPLSARLAAANRSLIIQPYAAATVRRQNRRHGPWRESRCRYGCAPKPGSQPNDQPPISDQVCRKNSAKCA